MITVYLRRVILLLFVQFQSFEGRVSFSKQTDSQTARQQEFIIGLSGADHGCLYVFSSFFGQHKK